MTTNSCSKRMSVDVSDLVDQLRPYTPQSSRKTSHDAPLNSFDANSSTHVFSSPLPPPNHRGKPTADEAAKVLLEDDPFLKLRSPCIENRVDPHSADVVSQPHLININAPSPLLQAAKEDVRVSASFRIRAPEAALAFSPVLPQPLNEALPPTEPLLSTSSSPSSYPLTHLQGDPPTPVSAAKPPRPPIPRLEPLHSSSEQQPQGCHSPTPSTPFGSTIPLSYSAVKTPGGAPLNYLGETPASAKQGSDPSSMLAFFRSRSAHVTSPIFSARKKIDCEDLGSPEVRVNPLADSTDDMQAVPHGVLPEVVVRMDFSLGYGFDRAEDVDLSSRANRVPVLYAVVVRTTDLDGDIRPMFARLERDSDSPHTMLVDVVEDGVQFVPVEESQDSSNGNGDRSGHEAVLSFWAAPDSFIQFGSATLLLTVVDRDEMSHETKVELHVVGTEPTLAVETRENHPEPERKETTVMFKNSRCSGEETVTIRNQTFGGAPLLINALITDSAAGSFTIRDREGQVRDCIPMLIPGGKSYSFTACFGVLPNVTLRGRYYGCVLLKLATLLPSKGRHTSSDIDLHQFYDHVLNLEAHIIGIAPPDRLSTLEDPSSSNIEEMLYEHRYGNDHPDLDQQRYAYSPSQYSRGPDGVYQDHSHSGIDHPGRDVSREIGVLKKLSLVVSPEEREPLPEGFETKSYMVCEYSLGDAPRWVSPEEEFIQSSFNQEELKSVDTEMREPLNDAEGESNRLEGSSPESPSDARNQRYSRESYEEWKKSLEDVETALGEDDGSKRDVDVRPHRGNSGDKTVLEDGRGASALDANVDSLPYMLNESVSNLEPLVCGNIEDTESPPENVMGDSAHDRTESAVEEHDLLGSSNLVNLESPQEAAEDALASEQLRQPTPRQGAQTIGEDIVPIASPLVTNPKVSTTIVPELQSSQVRTISQEPALDKRNSLEQAAAKYKKPPLPTTRMLGKTSAGGQIAGHQDGGAVRQDVIPRLKETTRLVGDAEDGVSKKSKKSLKGIISTLGASVNVNDQKGEHGFLQQYTKFDSNFNMCEDLSAKGSRNVSISSAGSLATINAPQRPGIRNLTSKWGINKSNEVAYRPKLRIPRKLLEKGLSISADSGTTKLTVCNGSLTTIGVDITAKQGLKRKAQVLIEPRFLALRPEQKAVFRLTRLASEESKASVVLDCSNLNGPKLLSCTYRLPIVIKAAKNRVPIVQGFAVDRPTLTFYNPKSTGRHCRVRVLNGTKRKVSYKVWIGKDKDSSDYRESAFSILSHHEGTVEPNKCFSVIVVFDALGQTNHFHEELCIRVGRKTDFIPMFGYCGASNFKFSRSKQGHLRVHNSGSRHGFLILSGPEVESPDNAMIRAVLGPDETQDFVPPYGSGTIIFTGDEIARTRLCRSHELLESAHGERIDESSLFLGHFDGQEQAAEAEGLLWDEEDKHSLHYAGRLVDSNTKRFMFDTNAENIVPYVERNREADVSWHASLDGSRFIHIENYDSKHELAFTAVGTEPNAGSIPPLGDAIVAAFADTVRIYARGQCQQLE